MTPIARAQVPVGGVKERSHGPTSREGVVEAIAREAEVLGGPEREADDSRTRLAALRAELASIAAEPEIRVRLPVVTDAPVPRAGVDKVRLFRALFRGRDDAFPTRFVSKKTGKPGYAPACRNKFVKGICDLPKVKCGECPNQAFAPVDDKAVLAHLQERHVMGVYPLLDDETCWFLAADFDKSTWTEDVGAFAETCRRVGLPAAVERSRSGNGAHVWFFFSAPVAAGVARKMGCYLLTETMSRRHELSMDSYDRLFPSQDTMPRGGFANKKGVFRPSARKGARKQSVGGKARRARDRREKRPSNAGEGGRLGHRGQPMAKRGHASSGGDVGAGATLRAGLGLGGEEKATVVRLRGTGR